LIPEIKILLISQDFQNIFRFLPFAENLVLQVTVFIFLDQDVSRLRHQAMVNPAVTPNHFLIRARVEEPDIQRLGIAENRKVDGIRMLFGIVIIIRIAGKPAQKNPFIRIFPTVQRKHDEVP